MNKINYQKELEKLININVSKNFRPTLLLHVCCAVCASYVLEYLTEFFDITIAYYNPNITNASEYDYRYSELKRLVSTMPLKSKVSFIDTEYKPGEFLELIKGHEKDKEGGARCSLCFRHRLLYTAKLAQDGKFDYFATTLTISPLKNAEVINFIGLKISDTLTHTKYLATDFKKRNGYKRSIELSKEYHLYRQNYCGCEFSRNTCSIEQAGNIPD